MRKVAILVAMYKASRFVDAKIENLKRQTILGDCNIVFLNCQNLENERNQYRSFLGGNITEIVYSDHTGLYQTWNDGIKATESEYVVNANVDDMWHPEYLERLTTILDENQDHSVAYSHVKSTSQPNQFDQKEWNYKGGLSIKPFPQGTMGPCPVWRRSLHDKYGMFADTQVIGDALMWQKWRRGGEKFYQVQEPLVLYFNNPNSLERRCCPDSKLPLREVDLRNVGAHHVNT
jgi:glycosyltransferase involved in cell wall biosynthesis